MSGLTEAEFNRIFAKANELWEIEFFQKHAKAAVKTYLAELENEFGCQLHSAMRKMESPLEAAFFAWWKALTHHGDSIWLRSQVEVTVVGQAYRLDFQVVPQESGYIASLIDHPECPKIAIELDGHDFHEKTKEQATYRNRRDRDLQSAGWIVLHVSGSEFNANPERVTKEIYERASNLMYAVFHKLRN